MTPPHRALPAFAVPRDAYNYLGLFATSETLQNAFVPGMIGTHAQMDGMLDRFNLFTSRHADNDGVKLLAASLSYVRDALGMAPEDFLFAMVNGIVGDSYPDPPRCLRLIDGVLAEYVKRDVCGGSIAGDVPLDVFPTEGGTAAMTYLFETLSSNCLLRPGDKVRSVLPLPAVQPRRAPGTGFGRRGGWSAGTPSGSMAFLAGLGWMGWAPLRRPFCSHAMDAEQIAIGAPIFPPYLEIPHLREFQLTEVILHADPHAEWQVPDAEVGARPRTDCLCFNGSVKSKAVHASSSSPVPHPRPSAAAGSRGPIGEDAVPRQPRQPLWRQAQRPLPRTHCTSRTAPAGSHDRHRRCVLHL